MKFAGWALVWAAAACGGPAAVDVAADAAAGDVVPVDGGDGADLAAIDAADATADAAAVDAAADVPADAAPADVPAVADTAADAVLTEIAGDAAAQPPGLTADFRGWLAAHGYDVAALARDDLVGGSFGGRAAAGETLTHDPVVFIHGNSDLALGTATGQTGWTASRAWFLAHGYTNAELYATTWGPADATLAAQQDHSRKNVLQLRHFVEAVLAYTGAAKIDIISHSMGVTLARKVVLGGAAMDPGDGGAYDVGAPLSGKVDTFVGIAGANLGLTTCFLTGPTTPTCGAQNGLYPGTLVATQVVGRSAYLDDLLAQSGFEGAFRYSIWSSVDEIIGYGDIVYGQPTSRLAGQTAEITYAAVPYGHFGLKDLTAAAQLDLVLNHKTP